MSKHSNQTPFMQRVTRMFFPRQGKRKPLPSNNKLGPLIGVFTPTILTILGVIM